MRDQLVMGNWKMHGSRASVAQLLSDLTSELTSVTGTEIAICPTYVHLAQALDACAGSALTVGAQDCSHMISGAFTGEVAAEMLRDLGCDWVLVGHSERRQYHAESEDLLQAKIAAAIAAGLRPVLCVGETLEQRENGEAQAVVSRQLRGALDNQLSLAGLVIAYEPVWAIGTGVTASPEQAQGMHAFIRGALDDVDGLQAANTRLLYGGSVKPGNAEELFSQPDIDGALVGGASLMAADFLAIVAAATQAA
jgi:triosephosphate isomerase